jgi:16S rRNA processing protein RimM
MKPSAFPSQQDNASGSPTAGEPDFLVVGKLGKPHGLHGEIVMDVFTDFPERIQPGDVFYTGQEYVPQKLLKRRPHARGLLVKFEGYVERDEVAKLRNQIVYVRTADRPPLEEGEYYHHQLLGMQVLDEGGQLLGQVKRILETGANDVYVIHDPAGHELLVPAIDSVILDIDLEGRILRIHLLPGLLPED